jgi:hypothetical protein
MDFGLDGALVDIDDDELQDEPGPSKPIVFDESIFNADDLGDDIPDDIDDEEDLENEVQSKLKV